MLGTQASSDYIYMGGHLKQKSRRVRSEIKRTVVKEATTMAGQQAAQGSDGVLMASVSHYCKLKVAMVASSGREHW